MLRFLRVAVETHIKNREEVYGVLNSILAGNEYLSQPQTFVNLEANA
jgi:hypothetical protein